MKISEIRKSPEYIPGWGPVAKYRFLVSRRRSSQGWPKEDSKVLDEARRRHDAGTVTMCQGRDGDWIIQYAIPSQRANKRDPYFTGA